MINKKNFVIVFLVLGVFASIGFMSSTATILSPLDDTNYTSSTNVIFNMSFINGTDFYFAGDISETNINFSFYSEAAGTRALLGNSSQCALGGSTVVSCWGNFTLSDGYYNITGELYNSTASINVTTNTTNIYFDGTAPAILLTNVSSPLANSNQSGTLALNVSIYDFIGVQTVFFNITNSSDLANSTTYTALQEGTSGNWVFTINTTDLADGSYNITVVANDSLGNLNDTAVVTLITFDNTNPSIAVTSSSSSRDSLTLSIAITDTGVGMSSSCSSDRPKASISGVGNTQTLTDRKSTRLNSSHIPLSRMPSSA